MPRNAKNFWIAALGATVVMGLIVSFVKLRSVEYLVVNLTAIAALVLFYYLLLYVLVTRRDLDALLSGLIVGVTGTATSVLFGYHPFDPDLSDRTGGLRGDPNGYSFIATVTLPLVALYYFGAVSRFRKAILLGAGLVILQGIIVSLSRTGIVAAGAAFLLWVFRFRRFDVLQYSVPVAIILGLALAFAAPEWRERFSTMTTAEGRASDSSIQGRLAQYRGALSAFASSPLVGVGFRYYDDWAAGERSVTSSGVVHSVYLQVLAELGLIGIVVYLVILLLTWRDFSRAWLTSRHANARGDPELTRLYFYAVFLQIGFLGAMVGGVFLHAFRFRETWMLFAASTAVLSFVRARVAELESGDAVAVDSRRGSDALSGVFPADGTRTLRDQV
jgi:O-antigen ligase